MSRNKAIDRTELKPIELWTPDDWKRDGKRYVHWPWCNNCERHIREDRRMPGHDCGSTAMMRLEDSAR